MEGRPMAVVAEAVGVKRLEIFGERPCRRRKWIGARRAGAGAGTGAGASAGVCVWLDSSTSCSCWRLALDRATFTPGVLMVSIGTGWRTWRVGRCDGRDRPVGGLPYCVLFLVCTGCIPSVGGLGGWIGTTTTTTLRG